MHPPIDPAKLAAARELHDCGAPTYALIAAAMGIHTTALRNRASREKWPKRNFSTRAAAAARKAYLAAASGEDFDPAMPDIWADAEVPLDAGEAENAAAGEGAAGSYGADAAVDPLDMLARASGFVSRQIGRLIGAAEMRGGKLDKGQIDAMVALSRMAERWENLARESTARERQQSDEELAETLRAIDDRIIELADAEARRLVDEYLAAGPEGRGERRMADDGEA